MQELHSIEVICDHCGTPIELTKTLASPLLESQQQEYEARIRKMQTSFHQREKALKEQEKELANLDLEATKRAEKLFAERASEQRAELQRKHSLEVDNLQKRLKQSSSEMTDLQRSKLELQAERDDAVNAAERTAKEHQQRLANLEQEAINRAEKLFQERASEQRTNLQRKHSMEVDTLQKRLDATSSEIIEMQRSELAMRAERDDARNAAKRAEIEIQRRVNDATQEIREQAKAAASRETAEHISAYELKLSQLRSELAEAQKKATAISPHQWGEVSEQGVHYALQTAFPQDEYSRTNRGTRGADLLQRVRLNSGNFGGTILFEIKNTQQWSNDWIAKLKDDARQLEVDVTVIVSRSLPAGVQSFENRDGVWVCSQDDLVPLVSCLRSAVHMMAKERIANTFSLERKEQLFNYIRSPGFTNRIGAITESYKSMSQQLTKEKARVNRDWAIREQSLNRMIQGIQGLAGDLQERGGPGVLDDASDISQPGSGLEDLSGALPALNNSNQNTVVTPVHEPLAAPDNIRKITTGDPGSPAIDPYSTSEKNGDSPTEDSIEQADHGDLDSVVNLFAPVSTTGRSESEIWETKVYVDERVEKNQVIITLDDEGTSAVQTPCAGVISLVNVSAGDYVLPGHLLVSIKPDAEARQDRKSDADKPALSAQLQENEICIEVLEILIAEGQRINEGEPLLSGIDDNSIVKTIAAWRAGVVTEILLSGGDKFIEAEIREQIIISSDD